MKKTLAVIVEEKSDENGVFGNVVDCAYTMEEAKELAKELFFDRRPYRIYYREWDDENDIKTPTKETERIRNGH